MPDKNPPSPVLTTKDYLGDGVYADFDGWSIVLTTENGYSTSNTIYLDPCVIRALRDYLDRINSQFNIEL